MRLLRLPYRNVLFALLLVWIVPAPAGEVSITLLHTNDMHQSLDPLPRIAGYVAEYKRTHPNTLFVDAGDFLDRGSPLVPLTLGDTMYGAMARMGYDAVILGNHDWIYGDTGILALIRKYPIPVLGTNLATTTPPLPSNVAPTMVKELGGIRVGLFGITLDSYNNSPRVWPQLYITDCREATARAIKELRAARVDLIVAITHLGFEKMKNEVKSTHPSDQDLVKAFPAINVVIGAHTHTLLAEGVTRKLYAETGAVVVQAGASGTHVGRLTLVMDSGRPRLNRFEVENVNVTPQLPESPEVAAFLRREYARGMPNAREVVGEFPETMEFHNLAYWYADFLKEQAGVDIALVPRQSLYDEPVSFGKGTLTLERLLGYLGNRYVIRSTVPGAELLRFCSSEANRDRFHPLHHDAAFFSGDAFYSSGMTASFHAADESVTFDIKPDRTYRLVTPWPFARGDINRYRHRLPARAVAAAADPVPGLKVQDAVLVPQTTWELVEKAGMARALKFYRRYPEPRPDWTPWQEYFERKLAQ